MDSLIKAGLPGLSDRRCAAGLSQVTGLEDAMASVFDVPWSGHTSNVPAGEGQRPFP